MRFHDFISKLIFRFLSFRQEKARQFYLSVLILVLLAIIILTMLTVKQSLDTKVKENILKAVLSSSQALENPTDLKTSANESFIKIGEEKSVTKIRVYICGKINKAGVYEINNGTRVIDLIELAGGADPDAFLESINLAELLSDGQKIYIPSKLEAGGFENNNFQNSSLQASSKGKLVNINFASASELEILPGIGPELAQRIVDYRNNSGVFKSKEDLKNVSGIGEKKYEALKDFITI
ncbi:MAG: helix-hairpin-helix domain-containing protein [Candidatus Humimicrobiaceae bacterium]